MAPHRGPTSIPSPGTRQCPLAGDPPASPPLPEGMRHGETPLQADALVHQELPEEDGGIAGGRCWRSCRRSPRRAVRGRQHGVVRGTPARRRGRAARRCRAGSVWPFQPWPRRPRETFHPPPARAWEIKQLSGSSSRHMERVPPPAAPAPCVPGCPGMGPLAGPVPPATLQSLRWQLLPKGKGCCARTHGRTPC